MNCIFKKAATCRMAPCTEAQGVRCCAACPYKKCRSRCALPDQMAAAREKPPAAQSEGEQIKLEEL